MFTCEHLAHSPERVFNYHWHIANLVTLHRKTVSQQFTILSNAFIAINRQQFRPLEWNLSKSDTSVGSTRVLLAKKVYPWNEKKLYTHFYQLGHSNDKWMEGLIGLNRCNVKWTAYILVLDLQAPMSQRTGQTCSRQTTSVCELFFLARTLPLTLIRWWFANLH